MKKRREIGAWEIYLDEERRLAIESREGEVESLISARVMGAAVRALVRGRVGFSYTNEFTAAAVRDAVDRAMAAAALMPDSRAPGFVAPPERGWPELDIMDPSLDRVPLAKKVARARLIESSALAYDRRVKTVRGAEYEELRGEVWVANSEGVEARSAVTLVSASAEVMAEDKGGAQAASELETAHYYDKLDVAVAGRKAAEQAVGLLGARPVRAGKYQVVLSAEAACGLISVLAPAACGDAVANHRSWLEGKQGQKIAGAAVTIVDDALMAEGPGAFPFDDEGTASRTVTAVRRGVLENFLYDTYYGRMAGTGSTGNGLRPTYFIPPVVDTTNWVLLPGTASEGDLIGQVENGLLVVELMGLHTADAVAGEFSMGALGYRIRKGHKGGPVTGITIAGTLKETLPRIEAVADKIKFSGDSGSPALLIAEMDVSGPGRGRNG
ncbi:MAG TPA: TldD/PmbA family protein [bacterium]|nr:TldD/PmbA family protein [bacterium]